MKILALEASAVAASVALCEDEVLLAESYQDTGLTHSQTLLPMTQELLARCGLGVADVDLIAVSAGPGSFTGLRIGVATAKGLAWAAEKPCAGCSTLESMAWGAAAHGGLQRLLPHRGRPSRPAHARPGHLARRADRRAARPRGGGAVRRRRRRGVVL